MVRMRPAVLPGLGATAPISNVSATEWSQNKLDVITAVADSFMSNSRVFDVRAYGDIGTADDSDATNAAIDAAYSAGGGAVVFPAGFYSFLKGVRLKNGVTLSGVSRASTIFDFFGMAPVDGVASSSGAKYCILGEGELTSLPNLGTDVPLHSRTVTFASAPGLSPGDWFCIYNTVDGSFSSERVYYRDGEWCQVKSVSGSTVTVTRPTYSFYSVADCTNHKMAPMRTGVSGVNVLHPTGMYGTGFRLCNDIEISDAEFSGTNWSNLTISMSVSIGLANVRAWSLAPTDSSGTNYGLMLGNCQHVSITTPFLESERHGFTTGGSSGPGAVPNRDIKVIGGTINTNGTSVEGADCHGNTEYISFINVSMPGGVHLAGDRIRVSKCDIWASPRGCAVSANHLIGSDIDLDNNTYRAVGAISSGGGTPGLISVMMGSEMKRSDGHLRVTGDISIRSLRASSGPTYGLYVDSFSNTSPGDITVDLTGAATNITIGEALWGAFIQASGAASYHRHVDAKVRFNGVGLQVRNAYNPMVHNSTVFNSPVQGIYVAAPGGTNPTITSMNNQTRGCGLAGILLAGAGKGVDGMIVSHGDQSLNNNTSGNASVTAGANIYISAAKHVVYRDATVGTTQSTPTPIRRSSFANIGTLFMSPEANIGSLATYSTGVDTATNV